MNWVILEYQIMAYNTGKYFGWTYEPGIMKYWIILALQQCMRKPGNMSSCIKMLVLYLVIFFNISYHTIHVNISQYTNILLGISVGSWEWVWMVGDEYSELGMREKGSKWAKMAAFGENCTMKLKNAWWLRIKVKCLWVNVIVELEWSNKEWKGWE